MIAQMHTLFTSCAFDSNSHIFYDIKKHLLTIVFTLSASAFFIQLVVYIVSIKRWEKIAVFGDAAYFKLPVILIHVKFQLYILGI